MGLKSAIDAANRYAENSDILDKVSEGKIGWDTPEHKQQWNYFVTSKDSDDDIHTIYELAAKSLKSQGKLLTGENLRQFFDDILQAYVPQNEDDLLQIDVPREQSSSPEQIRELEKELGTEGNHVNETNTEDTGMSEQERELRDAILGGMREGPDSRF